MPSGSLKGRFGRGIRKGISSPLSLTSNPIKGREVGKSASSAGNAGNSDKEDVLVLDDRKEVGIVRMEAGGVAGRAFLGKLVAMRIGSSESRK